jgi:hypothetical protein
MFFILIFILFSQQLYSSLNSKSNDNNFVDNIELSATISDTSLMLGDKIILSYNFSHNKNIHPINRDFSEIIKNIELLKNFEILNTKIEIDSTSEKIQNNLEITLISFEEGNLAIPPLTFTFEEISTNKILTKTSQKFDIFIKPIELNNNSQLKEIPVQTLPESELNFLTISIILLFIIILTILLLKKFVFKKK